METLRITPDTKGTAAKRWIWNLDSVAKIWMIITEIKGRKDRERIASELRNVDTARDHVRGVSGTGAMR